MDTRRNIKHKFGNFNRVMILTTQPNILAKSFWSDSFPLSLVFCSISFRVARSVSDSGSLTKSSVKMSLDAACKHLFSSACWHYDWAVCEHFPSNNTHLGSDAFIQQCKEGWPNCWSHRKLGRWILFHLCFFAQSWTISGNQGPDQQVQFRVSCWWHV